MIVGALMVGFVLGTLVWGVHRFRQDGRVEPDVMLCAAFVVVGMGSIALFHFEVLSQGTSTLIGTVALVLWMVGDRHLTRDRDDSLDRDDPPRTGDEHLTTHPSSR